MPSLKAVDLPLRRHPELRVRAGLEVPADDGVPLATDVYLPGDQPPSTAVLLRTYLGKSRHIAEARGWVRSGFACIVQDVRGRYDSGGSWQPFRHERNDGRATAEWITRQPWSDGRIAAIGGSYAAFTAWEAAVSGHPAIRAVLSAVPAMRPVESSPGAGGVLRLLAHVAWWTDHGDARCARTPLAETMLEAEPELLFQLPLSRLSERLWADTPGWLPAALACRRKPDPILDAELTEVKAATLHVGGWNDPFCVETLRLWHLAGSAHSPRPPRHLIVGPWAHQLQCHRPASYGERDYGGDSRLPLGRLQARWLRKVLAGEPSPEPPLRLFLGGENRWLKAQRWRPERQSARPWYPGARGQLSATGASEAGKDEFLYDPRDPYPARWTPLDEKDLEERRDVVRYTTLPLAAPCRVIGTPSLTLWASTDAPATDWSARLLEVLPDGRVLYLSHGIVDAEQALASRGEAVIPGTAARFDIPLLPLAMSIPRGHRLRLEISSSAFPSYARNLASGEDRLTGTTLRTARQTVCWGGSRATSLHLPLSVDPDHED